MAGFALLKAIGKYSKARGVSKMAEKGIMTKAGGKKYTEALKAQAEAGKQLAGAATHKGMKLFKHMLSSLITIGTIPAAMTFSSVMQSLNEIFGAILSPLEPFLALLGMVATTIEVALTPLTVLLWEEFSDAFAMLSESMPILSEVINDWINDNAQLDDIIEEVIDGVKALIVALEEGLIEDIADLALNMLRLAAMLITTDEDGKTLIQSIIELADSFGDLLVNLIPLLPVLKGIVDWADSVVEALKPLTSAVGMGATTGGRAGPWGALAGGIMGGVTQIGEWLGFGQEGGLTTGIGPMVVHPNELLLPLDSPIVENILPNNEGMMREQELTNELLVALINNMRRHPVRRR